MTESLAIQIQITAGDTAGRSLRSSSPSIMVGRDADCEVVVDLPFVSRQQCELRAEGDQWVLVNHSTHGTRLGRKRVTNKPRAIRPGDVVRVGDESILQLTPLAPVASSEAPVEVATNASAAPSRPSGTTGRTKLWIGIGAYGVLMLGAIIFFATLDNKPTRDDPLSKLVTLTGEQIRDEIRALLPKRSPQELRMSEHVQRARELFAMRESSPDALYRSYETYKVALTYTADDTFPDPPDQRRFQLAQQALIDQVTTAYRSATDQLKNRQFERADRAFGVLAATYPAGRSSALYRSIQQQRAAAKREMDKR